MPNHKNQVRYLLLLVFALAQNAACGDKQTTEKAVNAVPEKGGPVISAVDPVFDFGQVKQGREVSHIYKIKNVGSKELVIENTHGS
jgi:hypothetical protein